MPILGPTKYILLDQVENTERPQSSVLLVITVKYVDTCCKLASIRPQGL